jgi:hypothetical protein
MLSILLTAAGLSVAGVLILLDRYFAAIAMGTLLTILIAVYGLGSVAMGVSSRPCGAGLVRLELDSSCLRLQSSSRFAGQRAGMLRSDSGSGI